MLIERKSWKAGEDEIIVVDTLDPTYSVVYFYLYPAVVAGFASFSDAVQYCDQRAEEYPSPGCWSVIQTGDEY